MDVVLAPPPCRAVRDARSRPVVRRDAAHRRRRALSRGLWALSVLFLAGGVAVATIQPAQAATNGSDWGPGGATTTNSAVTVAWNNASNPTGDVVPRDASKALPYTGGKKTYSDLTTAVKTGAQQAFGGMKLTVSQTANLEHQGVNVTFTGVSGGQAAGVSPQLDVFQCWGGSTVDGVADANDPDPAHCQQGVGGVDGSGTPGRDISSSDRSLLAAGDLGAETGILVSAQQVGTTAILTATVTALSAGNGIELADGAKGTVEFDKADGTVIAKAAPVSNGIATATATGLTAGQTSSFTARYVALPGENFSDSPASLEASVPLAFSTQGGSPLRLAGSANTVTFPPSSFADGENVTASLDNGTPASVGKADAFGGFAYTYTIPAGLATATDHRLVFSGVTASKEVDFTIGSPSTAPTGKIGDNVPNVSGSIPFVSVNGATGTAAFFNKTTTNEFVDFPAAKTAAEAASRTFELQTGAEAPGLGCGFRSDQPSTNTCWLVAVPRGFPGDPGPSSEGPLTPSLWAQRVQVKLGFQPVAQSCANGQARTLSAGSEILGAAIASWVPAICTSDKIDLGYTTVGDPQARQEYETDGQSLVFTSQPVDDSGGATTTLYAPVGLSSVTIGYRFFDFATGQLVTGVKLNARLVAKLLTESYATATDIRFSGAQVGTKAPWVIPTEISNLVADPEFHALNPDIPLDAATDNGDLVVNSTLSDADTLLWQWIVADKDAKAFLDGCPDAASNDSVINPFYSTRSYAECLPQKDALDATAVAERSPITTANPNGTTVSSDYQDAPVDYPPTAAAFPQPGWYERSPIPEGTGMSTPLALSNLHAREATLGATGIDVFHGVEPSISSWCFAANDPSCTSGPGTNGKWVQAITPSLTNTVFGVTDSTSAAQFQVATAQLCDDAGNCVGADTASLQKAAGQFQPGAIPDAPQPSTTQDEKDGAYPLTLPVYAQINTSGMLAADATTIATILTFMTTTGQTPGFTSGNLPPGYAPLTTSMVGQSAKTIAALQAITDPVVEDSAPQTVDNFVPNSVMVPTDTDTGDPGPVKHPEALATIGTTPATEIGFPQFGLITGLGGALAAGIAAPVVGRKRKVTDSL
jgi:hypothetical protein